jgi:hypothetical protein
MLFFIDLLTRIYEGGLREGLTFSFAPYLLTGERYWHYIHGDQKTHRVLAKWSLILNLVLLIALAYAFYAVGAVWWTITLFVILVLFSLLATAYAISSASPRMWWNTLVLIFCVSIGISLLLIPFFGIGFFSTYLTIAHIFSLLRARPYILRK